MNIVVTWPRSRPLRSYLRELGRAEERGEVINYRVANPPRDVQEGDRCYMVHNGRVRGWSTIVGVQRRRSGEVTDPTTGLAWAAGWFIVRSPDWHPVNGPAMPGFRGWRYHDG